MALTLEYMRELVRSRLDDDTFEDEYLDSALNQAQWQITNGRNFSFLETTISTTLPKGALSVAFPSNVRSDLDIKVSAPLVPAYPITTGFMDYDEFSTAYAYSAGQPTQPYIWSKFAGNMVFPAAADQDYTITFSYVRNSALVDGTTNDVFDIPDEFQELLMIGAYMRIAKREDDYDVSSAEKQDYTDLLTQLIHTYTRNRSPRRIHIMRYNVR